MGIWGGEVSVMYESKREERRAPQATGVGTAPLSWRKSCLASLVDAHPEHVAKPVPAGAPQLLLDREGWHYSTGCSAHSEQSSHSASAQSSALLTSWGCCASSAVGPPGRGITELGRPRSLSSATRHVPGAPRGAGTGAASRALHRGPLTLVSW